MLIWINEQQLKQISTFQNIFILKWPKKTGKIFFEAGCRKKNFTVGLFWQKNHFSEKKIDPIDIFDPLVAPLLNPDHQRMGGGYIWLIEQLEKKKVPPPSPFLAKKVFFPDFCENSHEGFCFPFLLIWLNTSTCWKAEKVGKAKKRLGQVWDWRSTSKCLP